MPEIRMPALGADMTSGRLIEWHVAPGDPVHRGDIVATVDTDKAEIDIETFADGVLDTLVVAPGAKVPIGAVLATVRAEGDGTGAPSPPSAVAEAPPTAPAPVALPPSVHRGFHEPAAVPGPHRRRVTPLARRVAGSLGVDLGAVEGTGPDGAVTRADVEAAAGIAAHAVTAPPGTARAEHRPDVERLATLRAAVAALMARSKREIPHFTLQRTIDLTAATTWLEAYNSSRPPSDRLLPAALLLRAVVLAASEAPNVNGTYEDGTYRPADHVDLGVAVSLRQGGIIAPAIPSAEVLALPELMATLRDVTARARRGVLRASDVSGATLTVTNLGDQGADLVQGVIFPPQVALVGFGRVAARPVAVDGLVGARLTVIATLAADHRVSDGHQGSRFLALLDQHLQEPEQL